LEIEEPEEDEELLARLEEHARLQIQLDRKFGSLTLGQLISVMLVFAILVAVKFGDYVTAGDWAALGRLLAFTVILVFLLIFCSTG
jgi:hypothetical protein